MTKIYTRTGDKGETGLFGGERVVKDHPLLEAYGTVDELNAILGRARTLSPPTELDPVLAQIQIDLFRLGADLATPNENKRGRAERMTQEDAARLEPIVDRMENDLEPLKDFILPGGSPLAAELQMARTVCRRAERRVTPLAREGHANSEIVVYLNRLSDLLFVMARKANQLSGVCDLTWKSEPA